MSDIEIVPIAARRGGRGTIRVRSGTSDLSLVLSHLSNDWARGDDEYRLGDLQVSGVFVDVGAHIGMVALGVLLDNPDATAILVEPVPENMELARRTMADNGLADRCTFVEAAAGGTRIVLGADDVDDRWVGNLGGHGGRTIRTEQVTLPQLVAMAGGSIDVLKVDCEGGEWSLLRADLSPVRVILGEWHGYTKTLKGPERLERLLRRTHDLEHVTDSGGVGLFRAVRRTEGCGCGS